MKTAAAYIRVSTDDQLEYSPDSQLKLIRDYAKKNNMILPCEFIFEDKGISGRNTSKRFEFNRMIGMAKLRPKPFDVILLWKFSRFARSRQDSIIYKTMLRKQLGIEVISISESLGDDKTSILIEALIEAMDEYYSINLAEEVKRGMAEKAKRGEPLATPPFGYCIKDKNYIINPQEADVVKMIFDNFINGAGFRDLAIKINSMKILTHRGNKFENRTVEYILNNPVYVGKIRWTPAGKTGRNYNNENSLIVNGRHEPIIDESLWSLAQERLSRRKNQYKKYAHEASAYKPFMLRGLVKCSSCGSTLVNSCKENIQCHSYAKGICRTSHSISIKKINSAVLKSLKEIFENKNFNINIKNKSTTIDFDEKIKQNQLEKEYIKLRRVKQAYENGIDTIEEYKENKIRLEETIKKLKSQNIKPDSISKKKLNAEFIKKHRNVLIFLKDPEISEEEKNKVLRTFIDEIIFDRTNNSVEIFLYI